MATIFKPTYSSPVYEPARYFTKKGIKYVRFRLRRTDELVTGELLPDGRAKLESQFYWARIQKNGQSVREKLKITDAKAAQAAANRLELEAMRVRGGLGQVDAFAKWRALPIQDHIDAYKESLVASACTPKHINDTVALLEKVCALCGFEHTDDLNAAPLNSYLAKLLRKGKSHRTTNKPLEAMKWFCGWLRRTGRMEGDCPFGSIAKLSLDTCPHKRLRRAISPADFIAIVAAAENGPPVQCVDGRTRATCYLLSASTGLRAGEIAHLKCRDVIFCDVPHIRIPATVAKGRREDVLALHPAVADRLVDYVTDRHPNSYLFDLLTAKGRPRRTSKMMQRDCKAAGVDYFDEELGFADMHSHRTSFITNAAAFCDQSTLMKIARHTDGRLTAKFYHKSALAMQSSIVSQLMLPTPANWPKS